MTREWKLFVRDIYHAIQHIKEFVGPMKRQEFLADEKTRSAGFCIQEKEIEI